MEIYLMLSMVFAVTVIPKLSTCWLLGSIFHLGSSYASVLIIIIVTCDTTTWSKISAKFHVDIKSMVNSTQLSKLSVIDLLIGNTFYDLSFGIYNGNWTEWSAIWAEIICVISKLNEHAARVPFEITSIISDQGSITTLLHPFWNCSNTGHCQFKYFIDAVLSWFEIKFILI